MASEADLPSADSMLPVDEGNEVEDRLASGSKRASRQQTRDRPSRPAWGFAALCIGCALAAFGAASTRADATDGAEPRCPYLRLALSTPQRLSIEPRDEALQREFLEVFAAHLRAAGFEVVAPTPAVFAWEAFSQVEALGDGRLAWSYAFLPMPGLADGMIEFPTFSVIDRSRGERVKFTTYHGLEHFRITEFPLRAALASEKLAELYLPVARKLCAETTPESEQQRLERIRAELADEIERALARRKRQSGTLELRAEPDGPAEPSGPDAR